MESETNSGGRVTESALIERINRKLVGDSQDQKAAQMTGSPSLGHFFCQENELIDREDTIDLESIGRELGVLAPDETIARLEAEPVSTTEHLKRRSTLW